MNALEAYDMYNRVANLYNYTEVTLYDYRREIGRFYQYGAARHGEEWDMLHTTPRDIHQYMASCLADGKSPATVNRSRDALSSLFRALIVLGQVAENPVEHIRSIRYQAKARHYLDEQHAMSFIHAIGHPQIQLAIRTMYFTGIRISELLGLTVGDVDLEGRLLTVAGKGRKYRKIPLHERELFPYLREYMERVVGSADRYAPLFQTPRGRLSLNMVNSVLRKVSQDLGATVQVTCHVFRHSFATGYLYNGGHLHELQYILGHNHIETTAEYLHVDLTSIRFHMENRREEGQNEQPHLPKTVFTKRSHI